MNDVKTILLTTDFSETSRKAIAPAVTLAKKFGAKILVAYIEEDRLPPMVIEYMAVGIEDLLERQKMRAVERLDEFAKQHFDAGVTLELCVVMGTPHTEIVGLAEDRGADLIVMATHGRGFISHAIMGSTTERVLRRASCPVLIVRDPDAT